MKAEKMKIWALLLEEGRMMKRILCDNPLAEELDYPSRLRDRIERVFQENEEWLVGKIIEAYNS